MRPPAVIFVGNGFTIGLSEFLGILDWHDTRQIIPPPQWMQEQFAKTGLPLWSEQRYPALWGVWHKLRDSNSLKTGPSFSQLAASIALEPCFVRGPHIDGQTRLVSYIVNSPGLQLRHYLWHFFHALAERFVAQIESTPTDAPKEASLSRSLFHATAKWPLLLALRELADVWDLTIVSYNYDSYLEQILQAHGCHFIDVRFRSGIQPEVVPSGKARVIHCHGELSTQRVGGNPFLSGSEPNLLSSTFHLVFTDEYNAARNTEVFFPPRLPCPDFPDLVPPGHDETHLLEATDRSQQTIRLLVERARVVGSVGFSAAAPDDKEFQGYLDAARDHKTTFTIGGKSEVTKLRSSELLAGIAQGEQHAVFKSSEVDRFLVWVRGNFLAAFVCTNKTGTSNMAELFHLALQAINQGEHERMRLVHLYLSEPAVDGRIKTVIDEFLKGEAKRQTGQPDQALQHYHAAIAAAKAFDGDGAMAITHLALKMAQCFLMVSDPATARQCLDYAKACAPPKLEPWDEAEMVSVEAQILGHEGNQAGARDLNRKSYTLYLSINDYPNAALAMLMSGHASLQNRDFAEAEAAYYEALKLYRDRGVRNGEGMTLAAIAQMQRVHATEVADGELRSTRLRASIETYGEAIRILDGQQHHETAQSLIGLAQAHYLNGNNVASLTAIRRARKICEAVPLPHLLSNIMELESWVS